MPRAGKSLPLWPDQTVEPGAVSDSACLAPRQYVRTILPHDWPGLPLFGDADRDKVDTDNQLFEIFITLADSVYDNSGMFILEHPSDPGPPFPSIWACSKVRA
eukprot:4212373-Amphidinium_carterae.1